MRRAPLGLVLSLFVGCLFFIGLSIAREAGAAHPPLPLGARTVVSAAVATAAVPDELLRAGYVDQSGAAPREGGRSRRSFVFRDASGLSAMLRDDEYPESASISRQLALEVRCAVPSGDDSGELARVTPSLVAAAERAVRTDPAVAAGLAHLAGLAGRRVTSDALRAEVLAYLKGYRQPSGPLREVCAGCSPGSGLADEYPGGPDLHAPLRQGWPGWEIAGIRRHAAGESSFSVEVTVRTARESAR